MGRRTKQTFLQERHLGGQQAHKKMFNITVRERQIKTTMRYHLTLVRMAISKKPTNNKFWRGWGEKETLLHCWWEGKLIQPLWRTVQRFLKKLGIKLLYVPTIPLLGIYPEEAIIEKDTHAPMFIEALFTIARTVQFSSVQLLSHV